MTATPTRARHHATTCCVPGCDKPRHEITSRNKSRFCDAHYLTRDQRLQTCTQPKTVTTDEALDVLHAIRPFPEPPEYVHPPAVTPISIRDQRGFADALAWSEMLIVQKGGRVRRPQMLDDEGRAKAMARLGELLATRQEISA